MMNRNKYHIKNLLYNHIHKRKIPFNSKLFERDHNEIIEELKKIIISCERYANIKIHVRGFAVIEDYQTIKDIQAEVHSTIVRARNKHIKENPYKCIDLDRSDVVVMVVSYYVEDSYGNSDIINTLIYVPIFIDKYYVRINGVKSSPLLQVVEGASYNKVAGKKKDNNSVTAKTIFGPIAMYNNPDKHSLTTIHNENLDCTIYTVSIHGKFDTVCIYLLGKLGLFDTIKFLELEHVMIHSDDWEYDPEHWYTFLFGANIYVSVPKILYDKDTVTQSLIGSISIYMKNSTKLCDIIDKKFWITKMAKNFNFNTISKGYSALQNAEQLLDLSTQEHLKLPEEDKESIYHILRWMMREFDNLLLKSNLSVKGKRIRLAEYLASLYTKKLAKGIRRIIDKDKTTVDDIRTAINLDPNYLTKYISNCTIVDNMDLPNDDDGKLGIKFSMKGPSGLGGEDDNDNVYSKNKRGGKAKSSVSSTYKIPNQFRHVDLSHIGVFDLFSSPKSDPGLGGILCPMLNLHDNKYLYDFEEPNAWRDYYQGLLSELEFIKRKDELLSFKNTINTDKTKINVYIEDKVKVFKEKDNSDKLENLFEWNEEILNGLTSSPLAKVCSKSIELDTNIINNDFWK